MHADRNHPPVAWVTGGTRGIGLAVAEALLEEGWNVALCSRSARSVESALEELKGRFGDRIFGRSMDVRDETAVNDFAEAAAEALGPIRCLVNNAGLGRFASVEELSGDDWRLVLQTNLDGAFYCLRAVAPKMKDLGDGWIINIASLASRHPFAGGAAYNASKYGLLGLAEAAMLDLRPYGIRVTTIMPGSVATDFWSSDDDDWKLRPEDVSQVVLDLLRFPARALPSRVELRPARTSSD